MYLGNGTIVAIPGKQNVVYATDLTGNVHEIYNSIAPNDIGQFVWVKKIDQKLQVVGMRHVWSGYVAPQVGPHWFTHAWGPRGTDIIPVSGDQFIPWIVSPGTTYPNVVVKRTPIPITGGWSPANDETIDLTSHIPASGARYVLLSVNSSGTITVTNGGTVSLPTDLDYTDYPTLPTGERPIYLVVLYHGQTVLNYNPSQSDFVDLRWMQSGGSSGGGHVIEDEGTPLTQRANLNFVGSGVTVTDDSGDNATVVTIPGGSGGAPGFYTITYASTINWDLSQGSARVVLAGNPDIANPTNLGLGEVYFLSLVQDSNGARTINSWGSKFKFPGNSPWDLSTIHGREDVITFVSDGTYLYPIALSKNVTNTSANNITFERYSQYYNNSGETTSTWSHLIGGNAGRVLMVCCEYRNGHGANGITYNGVALTQRVRIATGDVCSEIWTIEEADLPATGTYTIEVDSNASDVFSFCASSWYNVSGIGSTDSNGLHNGTSSSVILSASNGDTAVDCLSFQSTNGSETPDGSQTLIDAFISNAAALAVSYKVGTLSTAVMSWTFGADYFSHCGIILQQ